MGKRGKIILLILILFSVMYILKPNILKAIGWSFRDIYNIKVSLDDIESLEDGIDIQYVKYNWKEELEVDNRPTILVYHHTAIKEISPTDIDKLHKDKGWNGIGYHYYIRKDGTVYKGREDDAEGSHVKGYNKKSIGVCVEGNFEEECLTEEQIDSLENLSIFLCLKYDINEILQHKDLGKTLCPGNNFPIEEIKKSVIDGMKSVKKDLKSKRES